MYYCALSLGVWQHILPRFLVTCAIWCVLELQFPWTKYNYLNNIDMVLLRTSYVYGGYLEYYFRLQFSAFWSMHHKTSSWENANFKMYPSPKKLNYAKKKVTPPPRPPPEKSRTPWQETQVTGNILIPWETLSFWKNISLPPPRHHKKGNLNLQEKEKTSLLLKSQTPTWKFSISQKNPNSIGKLLWSNPADIKPSPHEN